MAALGRHAECVLGTLTSLSAFVGLPKLERLLQLYQQQAKKKATPIEVARVLGDYVKHWQR